MRTVFYPYKMGSRSCRELAREVNGLRVYPDGHYRPRGRDLIINWGNSTVPNWMRQALNMGLTVLNAPENVANASNKLRTFRILQEAGVPTPRFTTNRNEAFNDYAKIYVRHRLTGHSGDGIEVIENNYIPEAPLYVEGIENHGEYRVHVFNGEIIDYIKKRRHVDDEASMDQLDIRNLSNGWIYTRGNLRRLERIENLALRAIEALGLDFGAVDIIKDENGDVFVLEVNTACGLADTTKENYLEAISELAEDYYG